MKPIISIIIPCYNSELTLKSTLDSVINQDFKKWEAIIVNDGSIDNTEKIALDYSEKDKRFKYFSKENGGLGSARNYGISKSNGNYILPLDSDNKLRAKFIETGISVFEKSLNVGVVYGDASYFGEKNGIWRVGKFSKYQLLEHNYIDACAIIKKEVFNELGLYDEKIPFQGHEDWEFWLRVVSSNFDFFYLEEITFDYRVSSSSMIKQFNKSMLTANIGYIKSKHADLYIRSFSEIHSKYKKIRKSFFFQIFSKMKF